MKKTYLVILLALLGGVSAYADPLDETIVSVGGNIGMINALSELAGSDTPQLFQWTGEIGFGFKGDLAFESLVSENTYSRTYTNSYYSGVKNSMLFTLRVFNGKLLGLGMRYAFCFDFEKWLFGFGFYGSGDLVSTDIFTGTSFEDSISDIHIGLGAHIPVGYVLYRTEGGSTLYVELDPNIGVCWGNGEESNFSLEFGTGASIGMRFR